MTTTPLASAYDAAQESIDLARGGVSGAVAAAHNFTIQPAHDPGIMCQFTIPRPDNESALEFTVKRLEYLPPEHATAYDRWLRKRNADEAAWNRWLAKVANGTAGEDETAPAEVHPVTPRELILKQLEMLLPKTTYRRVEKLTMGELEQIFDGWRGASIPAQSSEK